VTRTASCQCGAFRAIVTGEPDYINICHCRDCQRRSGAPLTCNAYFPQSRVRIEGEHKIYSRAGQDGRKLHNRFCPICGATVCWIADLRPEHYGVAVGCFNDPGFPVPTVSLWETSKYAWVTLPAGLQHFPHARAAR
jgi:hypothetical protein